MESRIIQYYCKHCKHTWSVEYPIQTIPPGQIMCPSCHKLDSHKKPFNFFKDKNEKS